MNKQRDAVEEALVILNSPSPSFGELESVLAPIVETKYGKTAKQLCHELKNGYPLDDAIAWFEEVYNSLL